MASVVTYAAKNKVHQFRSQFETPIRIVEQITVE